MNKKNMIAVLLALLVIVVPFASAQTFDAAVVDDDTTRPYLTISTVKINGDTAEDGDILQVERGETLDIRVTLNAGQNDVENAEIQAFIAGYRYSKYERELVSDFKGPFNLPAGNKKSYDLSLQIPYDMEQKDAKLRIVVSDENSPYLIIYNYQLNIEGADESNAVIIRDFLISPSSEIEAGRALSFKVRVKNIGMSDLDDVKVTVSIPELNIQTYETIDELEAEETQSFEALLLRIPTDAKKGTYDVIATVEFDKYEKVKMTKTITVTGEVSTTPSTTKTTVTMPESVEVVKGTSGAVYPILLQNHDTVAKTYVVSVSGVSDWATSSFEPSSVVIVNGGESKTVYLKLSAKDDAEAGDKVFRVMIQSGSDVSESTAVASLKDGQEQKTTGVNLRAVLEWALIILIIVLIVLGLVLVFTRMRKSNKDDDEETQTYY